MKKFLLLGSSGFLGKNLTKYLISKDCSVLEFDVINDLQQDLRINNNFKLREAISSCDFIFFLAFDVGGSKFLKSSSQSFTFLSNNTKIISNTFEILKEFDKKFIFISSYFTNNFSHSYGLLKLLGEQFSYSLNGLVIRLYNVYGLEDISIRSHVIPDMIDQALNTNQIVLNTSGEEKRQFLHVLDCCEALYIASLKYSEILCECNLFDLTSFEWISIKNVSELVGKKLNSTVIFSKEKAMYNFISPPNRSFLKYWEPKISLDEGISGMINELRNKI